jgi:hypothetical protein
MREKINENPMYQVGIIAVLVVLGGFLFITRMGGGEEEEAPLTEATVSVEGSEATGTATGATPGEAVEGAVEEATAGAAAEATSASAAVPSAVVPSTIQAPPLPRAVQDAYKADQTVVLLIVHNGGIDDKIVETATQTLEGESGVSLFVVPAKQIYRYASITLGVEVSRVPALVVMRPRKLSGGTPQASVSYGFQTSQDVRQAVRDADYDGAVVDYNPG